MLDRHENLRRKLSNSQDDGQTSESSSEYDMSGIITSESKEELVTDVAERFEIKTASLKGRRVIRNSMRATESKSLDNLLQNRRQETDSKIRRRFGSSKFYVNKATRKQVFDTGMYWLEKIDFALIPFAPTKQCVGNFVNECVISFCSLLGVSCGER